MAFLHATGWWARSAALLVSVGLLLVGLTSRGRAQEPVEGTKPDTLFAQGVALADLERWTEAERLFEQVCQLAPTPNAVFNLAVARFQQGKAKAALEALDQLAALPPLDAEDAKTVGELRALFLEDLATLVVDLQPPFAELLMDGEQLGAGGPGHHVTPGHHRLRASAAGYQSRETEVELPAGERSVVHLSLPPVPAPTPVQADSQRHGSRRRRWAWAAASVFVVGAAVTTGLLLRDRSGGVAPCPTGNEELAIGGCQ